MSLKRHFPTGPTSKSRESCIQVQKNLELLYNTALQNDSLKLYMKMKYQGIIYKIGDFVEVHHAMSNLPYVCRIVTIATLFKDQNDENAKGGSMPVVRVEWCMKKPELPKNKYLEKYEKVISTNEVFPSGQIYVLPCEAIIGKCEILNIEEYGALGVVENSIYFTRARYDVEKEKFDPEPIDWGEKYCICQRPYNPDMEYIECEQCQKWFHNECLSREMIDLNDFMCETCARENKRKKK